MNLRSRLIFICRHPFIYGVRQYHLLKRLPFRHLHLCQTSVEHVCVGQLLGSLFSTVDQYVCVSVTRTLSSVSLPAKRVTLIPQFFVKTVVVEVGPVPSLQILCEVWKPDFHLNLFTFPTFKHHCLEDHMML